MNALKEGKLGLEGGLGVEEFELLIEAYVKIDPSETEAWIRECQQDLPNLFLSKAFEALGKCL
ncbi:MAG: hypothetical protein HWD61_15780 [Parachlamydiaceae bacterium]|nr:MAG: hypothetical protein HWD61_15780 [Parachlamydiaceae bacterium]